MEPIATYSETRFDGKRTFTLLPTEVVVAGSTTLGADFHARIPLASLDPNFSTARVRHPIFWRGLGMLVVALVVCEILVDGFGLTWTSSPTALIACIGMAGALLSAATARKVEFIRFTSHAGVTVLDLARSGPERAGLDAFVDALVEQVRAVSGAT